MASSVTLVQRINNSNGSILFEFSDNVGLLFDSQAALDNYCSVNGMDQSVIPELKRYLISWSRGNGNVAGKTATFNISANSGNVVRIQ
jgi:hypothetical protein